jgi:hypothetical protein
MILRQLCQIRLRFLVQLQNELLLPGNMYGAENWHRILNAIERLQVTKPAEGETVH